MFKINKKLEYALVALKYMSQKPREEKTTAREISRRYGVPFDPTSRVLQIMAQNGILKAEHGVHGGYYIAADLEEVTLAQLSEMIEGPIKIAGCFHDGHSLCDLTRSCNLIGPMLVLNEKILKLFDDIRIADLIGQRHAKEPFIRRKPVALAETKSKH